MAMRNFQDDPPIALDHIIITDYDITIIYINFQLRGIAFYCRYPSMNVLLS